MEYSVYEIDMFAFGGGVFQVDFELLGEEAFFFFLFLRFLGGFV